MIFHSLATTTPEKAPPSWRRGAAPALLLSCALHLLVFWPPSPPVLPQRTLKNLVATLRAAPRERGATVPVLLAAASAASRSTTVAAPQPTSIAPLPASAETAPATVTAESQRAREVNIDGSDGDAMRRFRIALGRSALEHMRYPPLAQQQGWKGRAEVRVALRGNGAAHADVANVDIALARSSGHDELDRAAVETLRHAIAVTPPPATLLGRDFAFDLPVIFELAEE